MHLRNKDSWHLEIAFVLFLGLIVNLNFISAVKINEVELNPTGADKSNEWIELYNSDEINLAEYKLVNNDGKSIDLNGLFSGYYVYQFENQWLDNSNEKIFLYKGDELIDQTDIIKDDANNGKSWSFCDNGWKFAESTRGKENNCENKQMTTNVNISDDNKNKNKKISDDNAKDEKIIKLNNLDDNKRDILENSEIEKKENKVIFLEPKSIKSEKQVLFKSKNEIIKEYAIYAFALFCVGFIVLFIIDRKENKRNYNV